MLVMLSKNLKLDIVNNPVAGTTCIEFKDENEITKVGFTFHKLHFCCGLACHLSLLLVKYCSFYFGFIYGGYEARCRVSKESEASIFKCCHISVHIYFWTPCKCIGLMLTVMENDCHNSILI